MFGLMVALVWAVPMLGAGAVMAHRALPETQSPAAPAPSSELTWEEVEELEAFRAPPKPTRPVARPAAETTPAVVAPAVVAPPAPEPPASGPLTVRLTGDLFATTLTMRCEDATADRVSFENGVATVPSVGDVPCSMTLWGGAFTHRFVHRGGGDLTCRQQGTVVTCR